MRNSVTFISICLTMLMPFNAAVASTIPIKIVSDINYPPYSYLDNGKSTGIYTDIIHEVNKRLTGYKISLSPMPWKRALYEVESNRSPIIVGAYKRPIKRPYLGYSEPILLESVAIFCHKRVLINPRKRFPDDFKNLRVGTHNGFLMGEEVTKAEEEGIIFLEKYAGATPIFRHILNNRLDCYVNDQLSILHELKSLPKRLKDSKNKIIEILRIRYDHTYLGTSLNYKRFPELAAFIKRFNIEIQKMEDDGTISSIVNSYKH